MGSFDVFGQTFHPLGQVPDTCGCGHPLFSKTSTKKSWLSWLQLNYIVSRKPFSLSTSSPCYRSTAYFACQIVARPGEAIIAIKSLGLALETKGQGKKWSVPCESCRISFLRRLTFVIGLGVRGVLSHLRFSFHHIFPRSSLFNESVNAWKFIFSN